MRFASNCFHKWCKYSFFTSKSSWTDLSISLMIICLFYSSTPTWFAIWHWTQGRQQKLVQQSPPAPPSIPSRSRIFPLKIMAPMAEHSPPPPQKSRNPMNFSNPSLPVFSAMKKFPSGGRQHPRKPIEKFIVNLYY